MFRRLLKMLLKFSIHYLIKQFKNFIMARLPQGILGGISGKVGNVIGSSWKGIAIVKSRPLSVANPKTAGQIAQREKMANIVAFSQLILASVIKPLWDRFAQQSSGFNDFVRFNIALFATTVPSVPANLQISRGKMVKVNGTTGQVASGSGAITVNWSAIAPDALSLATDKAYIVIHNATQGVVGVSSGTVARSAATASIVLPKAKVQGDVLNIYLAFRRVDGTVVSNTGFSTSTVTA